MQHILHKHFILRVIIQYAASNRVVKMDSSPITDSFIEARETVHSPNEKRIILIKLLQCT